jgi:L-seryl-tRNA(Ser) seleniumtransferase
MATAKPTVYESLGVRSFINASNNATVFGGSVMPTEVVEAMAQASTEFVELARLHAAAGRKIAETVGAEAAHVSNGACNGCALAIASCMTGSDIELAQRLPDTSGAKNEVVCYRHAPFPNYLYQAIEMIGGKLVKVGEPDRLTSSDFGDAIGPMTAAIFYVVAYNEQAANSAEVDPASVPAVAEVARRAGVPLVVDAAAELPPTSNFRRFLDEGADLVVFSGGKAIRGPQSTGLVVGRPDLVQGCALNHNPNSAIGRGNKVGKEEIVGVVKAVELFVERDEDAELAEWSRMCEVIAGELNGIPGVEVTVEGSGHWRFRPPIVPKCIVEVDGLRERVAGADTPVSFLRGGANLLVGSDPPVMFGVSDETIQIHPIALKPGEETEVGRQLSRALGG